MELGLFEIVLIVAKCNVNDVVDNIVSVELEY